MTMLPEQGCLPDLRLSYVLIEPEAAGMKELTSRWGCQRRTRQNRMPTPGDRETRQNIARRLLVVPGNSMRKVVLACMRNRICSRPEPECPGQVPVQSPVHRRQPETQWAWQAEEPDFSTPAP